MLIDFQKVSVIDSGAFTNICEEFESNIITKKSPANIVFHRALFFKYNR